MLALKQITFACDDPRSLAAFWAGALGYDAQEHGANWAAEDPRGEGPRLFFRRMPKSPTIEVPIHLDVNVPDREAEVERLLELGARGIVATKTSTIGTLVETYTVMRDPEGNGFCVQGPDPRKPHPYVGNVTFASADPPSLGAFWSEALAWPSEQDDEALLQRLRDARLDAGEFTAYHAIRPAGGGRPRLLFQRSEKSRAALYPVHLDLTADDCATEVERLAATGATLVETKSDDEGTWTVLRDPEGNPFCVD